MPQELQEWLPRQDVLTYDEISLLVRIGASLGVSKLRVTGGEPLTRPGVIGLFEQLQSIPGIRDTGDIDQWLAARPPGAGTGWT